jgi:hypothetical protein
LRPGVGRPSKLARLNSALSIAESSSLPVGGISRERAAARPHVIELGPFLANLPTSCAASLDVGSGLGLAYGAEVMEDARQRQVQPPGDPAERSALLAVIREDRRCGTGISLAR